MSDLKTNENTVQFDIIEPGENEISEIEDATALIIESDTFQTKNEFALLGFRSDVKWKKILSVAYLVFCAMFVMCEVFSGKESYISWWNFIVSKLDNVVTLAILLSPYVFLSYTPLRDKIPLFKMRNTGATLAGALILCTAFTGITNVVDSLYADNNIVTTWSDSEISEKDEESITPTSETGITGFYFDSDKIELACGETEQLSVEVTGVDSDFDAVSIQFISNDETIAIVKASEKRNNYFTVTGVKEGTTTLYVQTSDGIVKSDEINVTVKQAITAISFDHYADEFIFELGYDKEKTGFLNIDSHSYAPISYNIFTAISENEEIAAFEIYERNANLCYRVTPVSPGETYIYFKTNDGTVTSEKMKVTVTQHEEKTQSQEATQYQEATQSQEATSSEAEVISNGQTVYITPYGKKYHYKSSCAGSNATPTSLSDAQSSYGPCKKCVQ